MVDGIDQERLLIDKVGDRVGISIVTVLIGGCFQEAPGWQLRLRSPRIEIFNVTLVVGPTSLADLGVNGRSGVRRIGSRGVIAEETVVRNVVVGRNADNRVDRTAAASVVPFG